MHVSISLVSKPPSGSSRADRYQQPNDPHKQNVESDPTTGHQGHTVLLPRRSGEDPDEKHRRRHSPPFFPQEASKPSPLCCELGVSKASIHQLPHVVDGASLHQ